MMRRDPHPNSTAEKSRFSTMAVTAIHQRLAKAVARVGGIVGRKVNYRQEKRGKTKRERKSSREGRVVLTDPGWRSRDHLSVKWKGEVL